MFDFFWSMFGNVKTLLIGIGGAIASIWFLLLKRKVKVQEDVIHHQERVIEVHQKKEEVHKKDEEIDKQTEDKIKELEENVENLPEDQAAQKVADSLNDYFGSGK
jgi:hypothetical protein